MLVFGVGGLILDPPGVWAAVGYLLCGIGSVTSIGAFRVTDIRRRSRPGYHWMGWVAPACQILLAISWMVSLGDAWRWATELSR